MRIAAPMLMYMCSPSLCWSHIPTVRLRENSPVAVDVAQHVRMDDLVHVELEEEAPPGG
jgi:hypothetical protein